MSDNKENLQENEHNKKSTYFAESQKKYNDKCKKYAVKYIPSEWDNVEVIEKALSVSGMSANAWIKQAIREKLEREGFL